MGGKVTLGKVFGWTILALFALFTLFPIWVVIKTALVEQKGLYSGARDLLPATVTLDNFTRVLGLRTLEPHENLAPINLLTSLRNSAIFTFLSVAGQIFFSSLAAYAFARLRFVGRDLVFFLFLSSMMVPGIVLFIPNFILIKELGWLNTMHGMVAPHFLMTPFAVFFLRQFFLSTPRELEEAARLDGAGYFRIFWSIVLPVHKGAIATLAILQTVNAWNEFFWPFLVGRDEAVRPIAVALTVFRQAQPSGTPDWTGLMAATTISIIPVVVLLIVLGRRVVESLQFSGLK
jgi:multiple sugar transport system permease protein